MIRKKDTQEKGRGESPPPDPGFILASIVLLLAGCSSPEPAYYTLQMVPGATHAGAPRVVEVRRPGLAGYLDRSDVVLKSADYQLDVNGQIRWGEPLGDMIGRVLAQDMSQRLSGSSVFSEGGAITADPEVRIEVDIQKFDPDGSGAVSLIAETVLERGRAHAPVSTQHVALTVHPDTPGAAGVVAAMSALLGQLADQTATSVALITPAVAWNVPRTR